MESVDSDESDTLYEDFMAKFVLRSSGIFMKKTRQIKLLDNFYINFTIESP